MQPVFAIGLHSMHQDMNGLDRIAMNLTNSATPGYQRAVAVQHPFAALVAGPLAPQATVWTGVDTALAEQAPPVDIVNDTRPGTLKATGASLDLALAGAGWFEIATSAGPAYTRSGSFHVDARGRLVTAQGDAVMGKSGEIFVEGRDVAIDGAGRVRDRAAADDAAPLAQLKIVRFDDAARMARLGNGLLDGAGAPAVLDDADIDVRQGYLENANVGHMQEMVQLMQTMRHFESMQRVVQGYDEMLGTAIRRLGEG
jgi:flagellar basal-body rod protein FlgG